MAQEIIELRNKIDRLSDIEEKSNESMGRPSADHNADRRIQKEGTLTMTSEKTDGLIGPIVGAIILLILLCGGGYWGFLKYTEKATAPTGITSTVKHTWAADDLEIDWDRTTVYAVFDDQPISSAKMEEEKLVLKFSLHDGKSPKDVLVRVTIGNKIVLEKPHNEVDNVVMRSALMKAKKDKQ